jgi:hypothetical protein
MTDLSAFSRQRIRCRIVMWQIVCGCGGNAPKYPKFWDVGASRNATQVLWWPANSPAPLTRHLFYHGDKFSRLTLLAELSECHRFLPMETVGLQPTEEIPYIDLKVIRADFIDIETETAKNVHQCPSATPTTRSCKYGSPQP